MKRTVPLLVASALVATPAAVVAATGPAGAEPAVTAASDGKLTICHTGLGTQGRINGYFGSEDVESGNAVSGIDNAYSNERGCSTVADNVEDLTRFSFGYVAKKPYRLKSVRLQQTDGSTVTVAAGSVRVLMDEGDEVTVTFGWGRPKRR